MADGNLEVAQEDFDKASALAEHDPRVLLDEARVAAAKTDVPWLELAPAARRRDRRAPRDEGAARPTGCRGRARRPTTRVAAAPDDPAALRAQGRRAAAARASATPRGATCSKIIAQASQPETAYVLAALDLAEPEPLWTTVIDRLRLAAAGEGNAGRARAALVYALAKSGDVAGARAELAKLDALTRPYPLLPHLHAFVDKAPGEGDALDGGVAANGAARRAERAADAARRAGHRRRGERRRSGGTRPGEAATGGMKAAAQAIRKGDWNRARQIYEALVSRNPSDSEALSGLGDVERAQGELGGRHQRVQARARGQPVVPAGAARGGRHAVGERRPRRARSARYKDIVDRFPEGTYPSYVKTRAEAAGGARGDAQRGDRGHARLRSATSAPKPASSGDQDGL